MEPDRNTKKVSKRIIRPLKDMDAVDVIRYTELIHKLTRAAMNDEVATLVLITSKQSVLEAYQKLINHKSIELKS